MATLSDEALKQIVKVLVLDESSESMRACIELEAFGEELVKAEREHHIRRKMEAEVQANEAKKRRSDDP
jgi:hypothetical protein